MARIVIPGGSGYLGTHLAERLVARGDQVVVLTRGADHDDARGLRRALGRQHRRAQKPRT